MEKYNKLLEKEIAMLMREYEEKDGLPLKTLQYVESMVHILAMWHHMDEGSGGECPVMAHLTEYRKGGTEALSHMRMFAESWANVFSDAWSNVKTSEEKTALIEVRNRINNLH